MQEPEERGFLASPSPWLGEEDRTTCPPPTADHGRKEQKSAGVFSTARGSKGFFKPVIALPSPPESCCGNREPCSKSRELGVPGPLQQLVRERLGAEPLGL